jgi:DNA-binding Lrp family transcriptional regulator
MYIDSLDKVDNQILNLLLEDARMGFTEIGNIVGLSRTAVKTRVATLERKGIIKGYKAIVDPQEAPETMTFIINVEAKPDSFEMCKRIFAEATETVVAVQTTGTNCRIVAICVSPHMKTMRDFVNKICRAVPGITSVAINTVLDVIKGSITTEQ